MAKKPVLLDPEFIARQLIAVMSHDNNCTFELESANWVALVAATEEMINAGWEAEQDDIELIAAGEQGEAEEKFRLVPGYPELNIALATIFDSPGEPIHGPKSERG